MPKKKYKIAVIQLNLNDIAENNLKMHHWSVDAANLVISLPELYSSHYFVKEDVDNFFGRTIVLRLLLLALGKRIRCDYCSFLRKRMAGIYHIART
jgi:N-carbamoylputrescine amidase